MEIQFSSGIIWTIVTTMTTVGLAFATTFLIRRAVKQADDAGGGVAPVFGAIFSTALFVASFVALCGGGCGIYSQIQW